PLSFKTTFLFVVLNLRISIVNGLTLELRNFLLCLLLLDFLLDFLFHLLLLVLRTVLLVRHLLFRLT
ncbi:hypothetical protein PMAYCL1PPCAC_30453, partial [Pristionchus mayeri]